jgi:hypothetical protein
MAIEAGAEASPIQAGHGLTMGSTQPSSSIMPLQGEVLPPPWLIRLGFAWQFGNVVFPFIPYDRPTAAKPKLVEKPAMEQRAPEKPPTPVEKPAEIPIEPLEPAIEPPPAIPPIPAPEPALSDHSLVQPAAHSASSPEESSGSHSDTSVEGATGRVTP